MIVLECVLVCLFVCVVASPKESFSGDRLLMGFLMLRDLPNITSIVVMYIEKQGWPYETRVLHTCHYGLGWATATILKKGRCMDR
jgi:hypothetical protein